LFKYTLIINTIAFCLNSNYRFWPALGLFPFLGSQDCCDAPLLQDDMRIEAKILQIAIHNIDLFMIFTVIK
jgi:hypothetical protein